MLFAIIFAILGYRKAKDVGKNGFLWAFIAVIAFSGTQIIVGLAIGVFIGIGIEFWGWSENALSDYETIYMIIATVLSFVSGFFVLKFIDRTSQEEDIIIPPSPPRFDGN